MELRHLRYFCAVARAAHVGRGAAALGVSQPALSQQLRDLEDELGVTLFERHAKGVRLTESGQEFLTHAEAILSAARLAVERAQAVASGAAGRVVVALPEMIDMLARVTPVIDEFRRTRPGLQVETVGTAWLDQPRALLDRRIDVGFSWSAGRGTDRARYAAGIIARRLREDPGESALFAATHALAGRRTVSVSDLQPWAFALFGRDLHAPLHDAIVDTLHAAGVGVPRLASDVSSVSAAAPLIVASHGWTFVTRSAAAAPPAGTTARRIRGVTMPAGLDIIWRADDGRSSVAALVERIGAAASG